MAPPRSPYNPLTHLASLRLTIVLLSLSIVLIFVGTLAQVDHGIWWVVEHYFRSLYVWVPLDVFRPVFWPGAETPWDVSFIFPGGFLLLGLLVVNLIAAHAVRYKVRAAGGTLVVGAVCLLVGAGLYALTVALPKLADMIQQDVMLMLGIWALPTALVTAGAYLLFGGRKGGIVVIHLGLILLLLGEFVTGLAADEGRMQITERGSSNVIMDVREVELAFITPAEDGRERHVVVPEHLLERSAKTGEPIEHPDLPVSVSVDGLMDNSELRTAGFAGGDLRTVDFAAQEIDTVSGTQGNRSDMPSAYITLRGGGETLGRQLVSVFEVVRPIVFEADGRPWRVVLRFKRTYLPYAIQLHDFRNDTFTGTQVARNFSSDLRVVEPGGSAREAYVKMNQPLRYDGKAFFQAGYLQHPLNRNTGTILQVAENPGSWIPYLSCVIVTVGLCGQFGASLFRYGKRTAAQGVR
jgi:hypothetical protein